MWDVAIVGAGPAGAAAALGALDARPDLSVLLLDRSDFPRDKACGDGIAPHVLDVLARLGVTGLLDDRTPVRELALRRGPEQVSRSMARPAWVVPRAVFDERLVRAAVRAGATLRRHRVRQVRATRHGAVLDGELQARCVVGADGAHSVVRRAVGVGGRSRTALALRGYAPTPADRRGRQVIVFGSRQQPSYAWAFDRGDGMSNVGYGQVLDRRRPAPSRQLLLKGLEELLPGAGDDGTSWRGHHLPLSSWRWRQPDGPLLLAGDAAGLVNPMTGEGIYYAVLTGALAGRAAAQAVAADDGAAAGARYRAAVRSALAAHLRHTALTSRLLGVPLVVSAGVRAAAADQQVFDDLVEVGLARGRLTTGVLTGLARALLPTNRSVDADQEWSERSCR